MRALLFILPRLVFIMLIAGCSQESMLKALTSPEDEKVAKDYIALLQQKKFDQIENDIDPAVKAESADLHQTLLRMADMIPAQSPSTVKLVRVSVLNETKKHRSDLTYEYQYPGQSILVRVAVQKKDGVSTIIGFNVRKLSGAEEAGDTFGLSGKSALQYTVLSAAVITPLFSLYALILCIRTKMRGKKWLWIIAILLGVGTFSVNWATGHWGFRPISVQLFSASALAPQYGTWIISVSLPLGAILFLLRRKKLCAPVEPAIAAEQS